MIICATILNKNFTKNLVAKQNLPDIQHDTTADRDAGLISQKKTAESYQESGCTKGFGHPQYFFIQPYRSVMVEPHIVIRHTFTLHH